MPAARDAPEVIPPSSLDASLADDTRDKLRDLLGALAGEVGDLAAVADQLQSLFGQLMAEPPAPPHDALEKAQSLDGLVQRLTGMASFLSALSTNLLEDLQAGATEAASRLPLSTQASMFSSPGARSPDVSEAGECDLF